MKPTFTLKIDGKEVPAINFSAYNDIIRSEIRYGEGYLQIGQEVDLEFATDTRVSKCKAKVEMCAPYDDMFFEIRLLALTPFVTMYRGILR